MHDAYIGRRFRQTKITRKASDVAENLQLYRVVQFFHPRLSCTTTHISADIQRITLNASCMTISGGRTKQFDIFCRVTGFTSDFVSFIVVELIRFFHRALQLLLLLLCLYVWWECCYIMMSLSDIFSYLRSNATVRQLVGGSAACSDYYLQAGKICLHHSPAYLLAAQRHCSEAVWSSSATQLWLVGSGPRHCSLLQVLSWTVDDCRWLPVHTQLLWKPTVHYWQW